MDKPAEGGLGRDVLNAVGANFVSWFFSLVIAFVISVPFGGDAIAYAQIVVYCLLLWFYVRTQLQKGHRRRGRMAGWIAVILMVTAVMMIRIA